MKRLLLSVCLIGTVFAGHSPNDLQSTQLATATIALLDAERAMTNARKTPAPVTGKRFVQQNANFERVPSAYSSETVSASGSAPAPSVKEIFAPSLPQKTEPAAQPETSAPNANAMLVAYFAVGKNLNLLGSEQGWYQVLDPATSQRGWVYAQYYVEPSGGPGHCGRPGGAGAGQGNTSGHRATEASAPHIAAAAVPCAAAKAGRGRRISRARLRRKRDESA